MTDPVRHLAAQTLVHPDITPAPSIPPERLRHAVQALGVGLDHFVGERPLALVDPGSVLITTHRLLAASQSVLISHVLGAEATGDTLSIWAGHQPVRLVVRSASVLAAFLQRLGQLPPAQRVPDVESLIDPARQSAVERLVGPRSDRRPRLVVMLAEAQARRGGRLTADGATDLAARAVLLDRNAALGRGSTRGLWASPLGAGDLAAAARAALGPAYVQTRDARGAIHLELPCEGSRLSMTIVDLGRSWAAFGLGPCSAEHDPARLARAVDAIERVEAWLLLLRTLFGWAPAAEELLATPLPEVAARMEASIGYSDLHAFTGDDSHDGYGDELAAQLEAAVAAGPDASDPAAEARALWEGALASGDLGGMQAAAFELQRARLLDEAESAFTSLAERHPSAYPTCARAIGDGHLQRALDSEGPARRDECDHALRWYELALRYGAPATEVDDGFFAACEAAAGASHDAGYLSGYQSYFPRGAHQHEAAARLRGCRGLA